ncbi:MAG: DUF898 family protein [Bacilli bacterium]|jgi:signal transduction histidine kinase
MDKSTTMNENKSLFDGKLIEFIGIVFLSCLISVCTLGIAFPWALVLVYRWQVKHTIYDGKALRFNGTGGQLIGSYLKWLLLCIITLGIYSLFVPIKIKQWQTKHTHFVSSDKASESVFIGKFYALWGINILSVFLCLITLSLALPFVIAMRKNWEEKNTIIDGYHLAFNGRGIQLFGNYIKWFLLSIVTLGIYSFWIPIKFMKWGVSHTSIVDRNVNQIKNVQIADRSSESKNMTSPQHFDDLSREKLQNYYARESFKKNNKIFGIVSIVTISFSIIYYMFLLIYSISSNISMSYSYSSVINVLNLIYTIVMLLVSISLLLVIISALRAPVFEYKVAGRFIFFSNVLIIASMLVEFIIFIAQFNVAIPLVVLFMILCAGILVSYAFFSAKLFENYTLVIFEAKSKAKAYKKMVKSSVVLLCINLSNILLIIVISSVSLILNLNRHTGPTAPDITLVLLFYILSILPLIFSSITYVYIHYFLRRGLPFSKNAAQSNNIGTNNQNQNDDKKTSSVIATSSAPSSDGALIALKSKTDFKNEIKHEKEDEESERAVKSESVGSVSFAGAHANRENAVDLSADQAMNKNKKIKRLSESLKEKFKTYGILHIVANIIILVASILILCIPILDVYTYIENEYLFLSNLSLLSLPFYFAQQIQDVRGIFSVYFLVIFSYPIGIYSIVAMVISIVRIIKNSIDVFAKKNYPIKMCDAIATNEKKVNDSVLKNYGFGFIFFLVFYCILLASLSNILSRLTGQYGFVVNMWIIFPCILLVGYVVVIIIRSVMLNRIKDTICDELYSTDHDGE